MCWWDRWHNSNPKKRDNYHWNELRFYLGLAIFLHVIYWVLEITIYDFSLSDLNMETICVVMSFLCYMTMNRCYIAVYMLLLTIHAVLACKNKNIFTNLNGLLNFVLYVPQVASYAVGVLYIAYHNC